MIIMIHLHPDYNTSAHILKILLEQKQFAVDTNCKQNLRYADTIADKGLIRRGKFLGNVFSIITVILMSTHREKMNQEEDQN